MPSCFISHTWREGEHHFAMRLAKALKQKRIRVWIDENQIVPGVHIKEIIEKGIRHDSDAFLFVMSPESLNSEMCTCELNLAINQMEEHGKPIVPVLFKECDIPDFLRNICYADFRNSLYFDAALKRLTEGIKRSAKVRQLCDELKDSDPEKRIETAKRLGELKEPLALGPLKSRLLLDTTGKVKYWLATAIGEIGGRKAVDILAQAMEESDPFAQLGIIEGMVDVLKGLDGEVFAQALNILFGAIHSDNPIKRSCAIKILVCLKQKSDQIEPMISKLINDPDNNI